MRKNVIITGANRGIGKALVQAFANNGDNIWACIRSENKVFKQYIDWLEEQNGIWIKPICMELTDPMSIKGGVYKIIDEKKRIDILINCAGIGHMNLFQMSNLETIRKVYEVDLFAVMQICQMILRVMIKQNSGKIINVASTAANEVYVGNSIYGAAKASVVAFSKSLAAEVAGNGIQVNTISPGLTETEMSLIFEGRDASLPMERSALGRKILPFEIANAVLAMVDEKMNMVNGQDIIVNGGSK